MKIANKSANINNWIETMNKNRGGKCCIEKMSSEFLTNNTRPKRRKKETKRESVMQTLNKRSKWNNTIE